MSELLLTVLNMSLTASYVILFVILIRLLLRKAPKVISYALWAVVAFRLIIPFSFESIYSFLPRNAAPIPHNIIYEQTPQINSGIEVVDTFVGETLPAPAVVASVNPLQIYIHIGAYIWILGMMAMLVHSLVSILLLKRKLKNAKLIEQNIYEARNLKTPFVFGFIRPKIYLPVGLSKEEWHYILLHEKTHIHRYDHMIKLLAFLILSIHWFNPLVWIAFMLMSKDMELSCDERVLKEVDVDIKKPYATSLLMLATDRHILNGSPLAFGEGNAKGRIKNVLNYKKPRFFIICAAVVVVIMVSVGLLTNPELIPLPHIDAVQSIEMEQFDEYSSLGIITITDSQTIGGILSNLLGAKKTMRPSTNDNPIQNDYLTVRLMLEGERRTLCLYSDGGNYYIEEPYVGVYKSNKAANAAIYEVYTGNITTIGGADSPLEINVTEQTAIEPTAPKWSSEQIVGADMPELDYASDDIVIFHGYFGLFVYDLNSLEIVRSLDLKPLDCHYTQGDNYCEVSVSMDGNTVQLHPISSENMYVYTVTSNTLYKTTYQPMVDPFSSHFVPIEDVVKDSQLGKYSYNAVRFDTDEYGFLYSYDWTLSTLSYVKDDMMFSLFDIKESSAQSTTNNTTQE